MEYLFLVVAVAWSLQLLGSYWQLQRFHRRLAELRRLGRCAVGMSGNRWRGRTYGVLCLNPHNQVVHAAVFDGLTVFAHLRPLPQLEGMHLDAIVTSATPPAGVRGAQWQALQHAAQFFTTRSNAPDLRSS
ncbi:transcriptional regulator GutM [Kallotenue papyrolyticum]|uniref:transcriptional regulator GutM n=1 Tax=Kallotenue papyrolyticum TaxID=1325125 RepID=UPI0009DD364B|nr:transcriptional regulator GutM [Kallotenue papyrolyticum]